ncbi:MAG: alkaline phosphatase D [Halioglobus sp.]|jgi:alkaline phosphatase D
MHWLFFLIDEQGGLSMSMSITRRKVLAGMSLPLIIPGTLSGKVYAQEPEISAFAHGLASGDPQADSVVLWTRVSGFSKPVTVKWQLARSADFSTLSAQGTSVAKHSRDYTIKVVPESLSAGTTYYYRFEVDGEFSQVGRTRTLPEGAIDTVGIAVVSCSNYPFGYFNAYEAIALDPSIQFVLHLGDYIYEYGPDGYGGEVGRQIDRPHQPAHEIISLADYRERHAQYKGDPQSRMMHAAHPLIAIWDDHETTNNPWKNGAENHQEGAEGAWLARRDASMKAYFEWMPIRDPEPGKRLIDYWRNYKFGDLASLTTLESRHSARSEQISYADHKDLLADEPGAHRFMEDIVGESSRRMLSGDMEKFLQSSLKQSVDDGLVWHLIGNQIPMARTHVPEFPDEMLQRIKAQQPAEVYTRAQQLAKLGEYNLPLYLDPWDGYPAAREEFYSLCSKAGVTDLVVLTGDSHSFWENALFDGEGRPMGVELGTSGVTSPGDFMALGMAGAAEIDSMLAKSNKEIVWTDSRHTGYIRLQLGREIGRADYISISDVRSREYHVDLLHSVTLQPA